MNHKIYPGIFPGSVGYDAAEGEYVDLVKTGVIDPTKVRTSIFTVKLKTCIF